MEALARGGGDETVPLLLLEVSQILLAGAQLGASRDVVLPGNWEPEVGDDPDLDALRTGLATPAVRGSTSTPRCSTPYADTSCLPFRISDDIAAVAADLIHGLKHYQAGRSLEALWWWQYSYFNHWGTHGGAALRALHAVVAHASLDVAEETHEPLTGAGHPPRSAQRISDCPNRCGYTQASITTRGGAARPWRSWCRNTAAPRLLTRMASSGSRSGSWRPARAATRSWWSCPRWATPPTSSWTWPAR